MKDVPCSAKPVRSSHEQPGISMKDRNVDVNVITSRLELVSVPSTIMTCRLVFTGAYLERRVVRHLCSAESKERQNGPGNKYFK
jgi:hypothetical protein